jgi:hypothetical protein
MNVSFSVSSADFLAVLGKFRFHFFMCIFFFFILEEKKTNQKLLCVCLLIFFNFILRDNALVFCTQSLPATKYSLLHYWSKRRALVSKCTLINLRYACAVAALYLRVKHTSKFKGKYCILRKGMVQNHACEALIKDGRPTLKQTLKNPKT